MTPDPRRPGRRSPGPRRPRRADRGFVMLAVLMLTVIAVLAVGAMLTRLSVQTAVVERRIDDYRAHHDMLSVKAVVERWMQSANLSTNREDFLAPAFGAMRMPPPNECPFATATRWVAPSGSAVPSTEILTANGRCDASARSRALR